MGRASKRKVKKKSDLIQLKNKLKDKGFIEGNNVVFNPIDEEKMSEVLIEFVRPYLKSAKTFDAKRKLFTLAVLAWGASLLPKEKQDQMLNDVLRNLSPEINEGLREIVEMMIKRKNLFFADNKRKIIDLTLSETKDGFNLSVASLP